MFKIQWIAMAGAWAVAGCSGDLLKCGTGTELEANECVAEPAELRPSSPSGPEGSGAPDSSTAPASTVARDPACNSPERHGAAMVRREMAGGHAFCIDVTETTQAQYQEFLNAMVDPSRWTAPCIAEERGLQPNASSLGFREACFAPEERPNAPATCISWCQASAYCSWANKRLCGLVTQTRDPDEYMVIDVNRSEWLSACTNGGEREYSYGNTFDGAACPDLVAGDEYEVGTTCADATGEIFELSGGVAEWVEQCVQASNGPVLTCLRYGHTERQNEEGLMADDIGRCSSVEYGASAAWEAGIRCCADLVE